MAAYWIGEHAIMDAKNFEEYLRKVIPMIERFGSRYSLAWEPMKCWRGIGAQIVVVTGSGMIRRSIIHRNTGRSLRFVKAPRRCDHRG
jgi:hypothetical protein